MDVVYLGSQHAVQTRQAAIPTQQDGPAIVAIVGGQDGLHLKQRFLMDQLGGKAQVAEGIESHRFESAGRFSHRPHGTRRKAGHF